MLWTVEYPQLHFIWRPNYLLANQTYLHSKMRLPMRFHVSPPHSELHIGKEFYINQSNVVDIFGSHLANITVLMPKKIVMYC